MLNTPIEDSENKDCSATMFVLRDIEHDSRLGDANLKSYLNDDLALVGRWPCVECTVELCAV